MTQQTDARQRAVATTAKLLQRQGYAATGLSQVLEESGAPKGSFYYHFPGGKEELAVEAVQLADAEMRRLVARQLERTPEPTRAVAALADAFAGWLADSDYTEGCPITTVALEQAGVSSRLLHSCARAFDAWRTLLRDHLVRAGHAPADADRLSSLILCALEGAFVVARATRSREPFEHCVAALMPALTSRTG